LIARDGGCTKPGCTVPAYGTQAHHAARDWTDGGLTNVDDLALACGPDNRMVGTDGWTTRITDRHDVEWIPPPHLDTGQTRINHYHQPEKLHPPPDDAWTPPRAATDRPATNGEPRANDSPATTDGPATNRDNTIHQSGDPDPPDGKAA
ncbi:HNH endonuclease signature motif containing protein, partial [Mycolicibacterium sp. P9-64]|uniref:HNH endonuclease signature motif containing protein n=1 Tax=Mycolicibacterium sp. P9-64 TaxID=2024612 RepID=UPI001F5B1EAD